MSRLAIYFFQVRHPKITPLPTTQHKITKEVRRPSRSPKRPHGSFRRSPARRKQPPHRQAETRRGTNHPKAGTPAYTQLTATPRTRRRTAGAAAGRAATGKGGAAVRRTCASCAWEPLPSPWHPSTPWTSTPWTWPRASWAWRARHRAPAWPPRRSPVARP